MIEIRNLLVRTFDIDHMDVTWEVVATNEDLTRKQLFVLRSTDGAAGPFLRLAGPFVNTYVFRDPDVHMLHKWRQYFYKIQVVDLDTGEIKEFGPEWHRAQPDVLTLEMARREQLVLREFEGRKLLYYPVLLWGQHCRRCFDFGSRGNSIGRSKQQNCPDCYDSTFVGGFTTPMVLWGQIGPYAKQDQPLDIGDRAPIDTSVRIGNFPPAKPGDMIIDAENGRWEIERVEPTVKLGAVVQQRLTIHQIAPGDIRYRVPVDREWLDNPSPVREFSRPMTLNMPMGPV